MKIHNVGYYQHYLLFYSLMMAIINIINIKFHLSIWYNIRRGSLSRKKSEKAWGTI